MKILYYITSNLNRFREVEKILTNSKFKLIDDLSGVLCLKNCTYYPHYLFIDSDMLDEVTVNEIISIQSLKTCPVAIVGMEKKNVPKKILSFFKKIEYVPLPILNTDVLSVLKKFSLVSNSISLDITHKNIHFEVSYAATLLSVSETQLVFSSPLKFSKESTVDMNGSFFKEEEVDGHLASVLRESEYDLGTSGYRTRASLKAKNEKILRIIRML